MSLNLRMLKSDIVVANICYSRIFNFLNDEILYNNAAYHAEQATEKCLKLILSQYYNINENNRRYHTHDIPDLLAYIVDCETTTGNFNPIKIPDVIDVLSIEIKAWEANSRYNDNMVLLRKNIKIVIEACENMYEQMKNSKLFH